LIEKLLTTKTIRILWSKKIHLTSHISQ